VRFFAACIDLIAYIPLYLVMEYAFDLGAKHLPGAVNIASTSKEATDYLGGTQPMAGGAYHCWFEIIFVLVTLVSYAWFFASKWQGSPGMHLFKFHICDTEGRRISFWHALMWGVTGMAGWAICCAGAFYLQSKFDISAVNDLLLSCQEQNIAVEDCTKEVEDLIHFPYRNFMELVYGALGMAAFLLFIWTLSIALPKDKTGFHNILCRTRFVKGRPPVGGKEPAPA
jgi:uncharacterized RDD family membrane protein YckC